MIDKLIEIYGHSDSEENFHLSVTNRKADENIALEYLKKYHLPEEEYLENWKPVQDLIFKNQDKSLPEMMFNKGFSLLAIRGGILFEKKELKISELTSQHSNPSGHSGIRITRVNRDSKGVYTSKGIC